jgi:ribosomal protein S18 acetylase RimI-like enzyme
MHATTSVRLAKPADVVEIAAIYVRFLAAYGHDADLVAVVRFLKRMLTEPWALFFLATDTSNKIVGFVGCTLTYSSVSQSRAVRINDMFVDEEVRRHGVATALLAALEAYSFENSFAKIFVEAATEAAPARAFYTKVGFLLEHLVAMTKELRYVAAR